MLRVSAVTENIYFWVANKELLYVNINHGMLQVNVV